MEYKLVGTIQIEKQLRMGLGEGLRHHEDVVKRFIDDGWEPIGGIAIHDIYYKGDEAVEFVQAMIKR